MAEQDNEFTQEMLTSIDLSFEGVSPHIMDQFSPVEVILGESLLTPGLQTSVRVHSYQHYLPIKNLDEFKNAKMNIRLERPILRKFNIKDFLDISQTTYRLDQRRLYNNNTEEFVLHACDQSLLNDGASLVSKLWKCTTPSAITKEILQSCAGVSRLEVEESAPARDYMAENIHPFQVVSQQAQAALAAGEDPSFIHYMTYENLGTHHFKSLYSLTRQPSIMTFSFNETGNVTGYKNPYALMTHSFPCDFDLLSDILNGVDENGKDINSLMTFNPLTKSFSMFGPGIQGCGIGSGVVKNAISNMQSAKQQNACPDYTHKYLQKRQARMALLEQDKIALRLTVPWNGKLHVGKIITLDIQNKNDPDKKNYGSGDYLIASLTHNIKFGGFSTITMDCVSRTVGVGMV